MVDIPYFSDPIIDDVLFNLESIVAVIAVLEGENVEERHPQFKHSWFPIFIKIKIPQLLGRIIASMPMLVTVIRAHHQRIHQLQLPVCQDGDPPQMRKYPI